MGAQVLGRYPADQLAEFGVGGVAAPMTRAGDERARLLVDIDAARRRVVAARAELAAAQDPALRCVLAAQHLLAREQDATDRVVAAIESDADDEVERILGYRPRRPSRHRGRPAGTGYATETSADPEYLQAELDRLTTKAGALEHQVGFLSATPVCPASINPDLLDAIMAQAVAAIRDEHWRARERAMYAAETQLEAAREDRLRGAPAPAAPRPEPAQPGPAWAGRRPDMPGAAAPKSHEAAWDRSPSIELVTRSSAADVDAGGANPQVVRAGADHKALRAKPMLLDVVLPLIAVAIVLLVVLSWIG